MSHINRTYSASASVWLKNGPKPHADAVGYTKNPVFTLFEHDVESDVYQRIDLSGKIVYLIVEELRSAYFLYQSPKYASDCTVSFF